MKCQSQFLASTHCSGNFPENIVSYHQSCIKSIKTRISHCYMLLCSHVGFLWRSDWLSLICTSPQMEMSQRYECMLALHPSLQRHRFISVYRCAVTTWLIVYCVWPVGQLPRWATDWHMRWWLDSEPSVWSVTTHTIPANHLIYSSYRTPLPGAT